MFVPTNFRGKFIDENGMLTDSAQSLWQQLLQNMQQCLSDEGYVIPSVSSDPASVTPSATGGQLQQVEDSFGEQNGAIVGTVVFDPYEINGGSADARNGQLKVLLGDGTFHAITNT